MLHCRHQHTIAMHLCSRRTNNNKIPFLFTSSSSIHAPLLLQSPSLDKTHSFHSLVYNHARASTTTPQAKRGGTTQNKRVASDSSKKSIKSSKSSKLSSSFSSSTQKQQQSGATTKSKTTAVKQTKTISSSDMSEFDKLFQFDESGEYQKPIAQKRSFSNNYSSNNNNNNNKSEETTGEKSIVKQQRRSEQFMKNIQLLRTFVKHSEYKEALNLYQGPFKEQKLHIPIEDYTPFFQLISIKMPFSVTLSIYNRMKKEGVKPTIQIFQYLMNACSEAKIEPGSQHVLRAHKIITVDMVKWKIDRSVFIVNCFLKSCVNTLECLMQYPMDFAQSGIRLPQLCDMVDEAYDIVKKSPWIDRRPKKNGAEQEHDDESDDMIIDGEEEEEGENDQIVSNNSKKKPFVARGKGGINKYSSQNNDNSSNKMSMSTEREDGHQVTDRVVNRADKFTYSLLIQFYSKIGDMKKAFTVFDEMKKHFEAQSNPAAMLKDPVSGLLRKQSFDKKKENSRTAADSFIYNTLINGFIQNKKDLFLVFELYREMIEQSEIQPTSHTFSLLLTTARMIHNTQREYMRDQDRPTRPKTVVLTKFSPDGPTSATDVNNFGDHRTLGADQLLLLKDFRFDDKILAIYQEMKMRLLDPEMQQKESEKMFGKELVRRAQANNDPTKNKSKLDAYLINQMAQSLAQGGHVDEASNLVMNVLKPQFMLITPVTCVLLLRKVISKKCYSLEQFNIFAKPIMALMRDHMYTAHKKMDMITTEDLVQIVYVMLKNFKSHAMVQELCQYCFEHFKLKLPNDMVDSQVPGALRVELRQLYNPSSHHQTTQQAAETSTNQ